MRVEHRNARRAGPTPRWEGQNTNYGSHPWRVAAAADRLIGMTSILRGMAASALGTLAKDLSAHLVSGTASAATFALLSPGRADK